MDTTVARKHEVLKALKASRRVLLELHVFILHVSGPYHDCSVIEYRSNAVHRVAVRWGGVRFRQPHDLPASAFKHEPANMKC